MDSKSLTNMSSVGVSPQISIIGRYASFSDCLDFIYRNPNIKVDVISASYGIGSSWFDEIQELMDLGVVIVKSIGYAQSNCAAPQYRHIDGFIVVGDYKPSFFIMPNPPKHYNEHYSNILHIL